ncbi:MAG: glycosyltransferase family 2 protein, partial [Bacteroidales bacterium]|nr:glycosyltransferase family 2 protein [Bacteroidales bacterium]
MLLSFIIPAYNVEKYIVACLDSCLAQDIDDMEVIVVDDGSTDSTPALLNEYAQEHPCVKVFRQENQGQSVARNLAIERATGEYIYMVDSDDKMMEGKVLPIDTMLSGKYDIIGVQVMYQLEDGTRRPWSHQMERWPFDQEYATGVDFVRNHNIEGLVYGYLFKRSLFTQHPSLRFTPGIYHQDEELIFKLFTLAGPVVYK